MNPVLVVLMAAGAAFVARRQREARTFVGPDGRRYYDAVQLPGGIVQAIDAATGDVVSLVGGANIVGNAVTRTASSSGVIPTERRHCGDPEFRAANAASCKREEQVGFIGGTKEQADLVNAWVRDAEKR